MSWFTCLLSKRTRRFKLFAFSWACAHLAWEKTHFLMARWDTKRQQAHSHRVSARSWVEKVRAQVSWAIYIYIMYIKLLREWLEWGTLQSTQWQMAWAHQLIGIHFMSPLQHWTHPAFKGKCAMLLHSLGNNTKRWFGSQTNRDSTWFNIKCETQIRSHKMPQASSYTWYCMTWDCIAVRFTALHSILYIQGSYRVRSICPSDYPNSCDSFSPFWGLRGWALNLPSLWVVVCC